MKHKNGWMPMMDIGQDILPSFSLFVCLKSLMISTLLTQIDMFLIVASFLFQFSTHRVSFRWLETQHLTLRLKRFLIRNLSRYIYLLLSFNLSLTLLHMYLKQWSEFCSFNCKLLNPLLPSFSFAIF